ncbi:hypothetical protein V6N13_055809 [Hibiscus sabdariffa]
MVDERLGEEDEEFWVTLSFDSISRAYSHQYKTNVVSYLFKFWLETHVKLEVQVKVIKAAQGMKIAAGVIRT